MTKMLDPSQFDRIFGSLEPFPYNRAFAQHLEASRRSLEGFLFIDRVLKALNLSKATSHYPPKSKDALRQLYEHICESKNATIHHKLSVVYYIILDIDEQNGSSQAEAYSQRASIPKKYKIFMKGLWHMDALQFDLALQYLTHPSLQPDFVDDIITVLVRHAKNDDYSLPLAYYHTVQPMIQSSPALELLFDSLARSSVTDAFQFSRSHADFMRRQLFQRLILSVLESANSDGAAEKALDLTSLPFDAQEEKWFKECLDSSEGKRLAVAKDTLLMRRIATGQTGYGGEPGTWAVVLEGVKTGSGGRVQA
ncbi:nuclear pore complex assembly-domain-containing protein [Annulohypoxylon maeteangense]|uniref:nuclear pore complex assembly-domain-containing protein n=1 Tax=Annulohypoxylon maeteangense TaxID=1927788 RepID=UPI0020082CF9|nr:nuclear pore complex assembly-domain-containing protein [Annulohypoxylon maeteangense]KAI0887052.1 nuclear pore complex assembly-domain-containing protein [Annulohypoxylon maeteangense]